MKYPVRTGLIVLAGAAVSAMAVILITQRRRRAAGAWHKRPHERAARPLSADELVDEVGMQSFPGSDPPSY